MMCFQFRVTLRIALLGLFAGGFLSACAEGEFIAHATKEIQGRLGPKERGQTTYKIGNPYEINGVWYYPKVDYEFNESGIASWYGSKFHGKKTANGEIFDMNRVSAAHRTLPLPSVVRVTNLRNGRAINVRLNDRGPYAHGRFIDLSRRGAQLLGFERQGTAPVRVQVLAEESRQIAMKLHGRTARRAAEPTKPKADPTVSVTSQKIAPPPGTKSKAPPSKNFEVKAVATAPEKGGRSKANLAEVDETVTVVKVDKAPRIFVQAGAFARYQNAHKVRAILKQLGPTKISQVDRNQHPLFRVRIGPVKTIQQADNILASVIRAGYRDARTVID